MENKDKTIRFPSLEEMLGNVENLERAPLTGYVLPKIRTRFKWIIPVIVAGLLGIGTCLGIIYSSCSKKYTSSYSSPSSVNQSYSSYSSSGQEPMQEKIQEDSSNWGDVKIPIQSTLNVLTVAGQCLEDGSATHCNAEQYREYKKSVNTLMKEAEASQLTSEQQEQYREAKEKIIKYLK